MSQIVNIDPKVRSEAMFAASLGVGMTIGAGTIKMFSGGKPVDEALRDELLAKCQAGSYVELDVEMDAYLQKPGESNLNFVRVRDGGIMSFAQSAVGNPFLRDHSQNDSTAVGGRISSSKGVKNGEGDYVIRQGAKLTDPSMVARFLRGLSSSVSISWRSTDMSVDCSVCNSPILTDCYHFPGEPVRETQVDGKKKFVRDRKNATHRVEWVYNNVAHVETSEVPVPAVKNARIDSIRNSVLMSAGLADDEEVPSPPTPPTTENKKMSDELIKTLNATIARQSKIIELSDAEKDYFQRLGADAQDSFLAKSSTDRSKMFEIVYTAKNGATYTAMDDKRLVDHVKQADKDREESAKLLKLERDKGIQARAEVKLAHLSGSIEVRTALLAAVEGIEDATIRTEALKALDEVEEKSAKPFVRQGAGGSKKPDITDGDPEAKLEEMARELEEKTEDLSYEQAYNQVLESKKGRELYAQMHAQHNAKSRN